MSHSCGLCSVLNEELSGLVLGQEFGAAGAANRLPLAVTFLARLLFLLFLVTLEARTRAGHRVSISHHPWRLRQAPEFGRVPGRPPVGLSGFGWGSFHPLTYAPSLWRIQGRYHSCYGHLASELNRPEFKFSLHFSVAGSMALLFTFLGSCAVICLSVCSSTAPECYR